jgi:tungstate transport system substrate-binding protein
MRKYYFVLLILALILTACGSGEPEVLRLATTTSTENSGLLEAILPAFEEEHNAQVNVVAVGTGQAIALGEAGDADVILVHARSREDAFIEAGHGTARYDVMYNDFILVGPTADPANIRGMSLASEALAAIAGSEADFASRGDDSGTHTKERELWEAAGLPSDPAEDWYNSLGQGMGATLQFANETGAYTITDRGTYLSMRDNLSNLEVLVGGASIDENADPALLNPYGIIPVNLDKGNINDQLSADFVNWLTSLETQEVIGEFGTDTFGQPLFYPDSEAWRSR